MNVSRPLLRWHGGKYRLAPWIIQYLPPHRIYVEPYGGAASVLLRKPPAYSEVYNDLEDGVVGLFRVLREPEQAHELCRRLDLTPYSRSEFREAFEPTDDPIEAARRLIIRSFMGFGSDGARTDKMTGFRANSNRSGTTPAHDWANYPGALRVLIERLRGVVIEHRDALTCMTAHDSPDTLHYVDPPYLPETRQLSHRRHGYLHELTEDDHIRLLGALRRLDGMVVLSGYPSELYADTLADWSCVENLTYADSAKPRREMLWINPAANALLLQPDMLATFSRGTS